jgi:hypothetical protein
MSVLTNPFRLTSAPPPAPHWERVIEDSFGGGDVADIEGRTPDVLSQGSTWAKQGGGATLVAAIVSGKASSASTVYTLELTGGDNGVAVQAKCTVSTASGTDATVSPTSTGTQHCGIGLQMSSTNRYYRMAIKSGQWFIYRNNATTASVLAVGADAGLTTSSEHTVRLERIGNDLTAYLNGVEVWTGTDSTVTGGTGVGIASVTTGGTEVWDDFVAEIWIP